MNNWAKKNKDKWAKYMQNYRNTHDAFRIKQNNLVNENQKTKYKQSPEFRLKQIEYSRDYYKKHKKKRHCKICGIETTRHLYCDIHAKEMYTINHRKASLKYESNHRDG